MSHEPEAVDGAFRITSDDVAVYATPRLSLQWAADLNQGDLIVVTGAEGDFLRVITHEGLTGYIPNSTPLVRHPL